MDNENNVSIRLKNFDNYSVKDEEKKVKLIGEKVETHFYQTDEGMEFEVLLKTKPKINIIEFSLIDKDVSYFYQPSLKKEKLEEGQTATDTDIFDKDGNVVCHRPINVVGSYAVYSKSSKINYINGKEYKCGKIGHIYRPKIIDSAGTEIWGKLKITDNLLSVEIPQKFLDNAIYPVRHAAGLEFGYTPEGTSGSANFYSSVIRFDNATGVAGTGVSMSAYVKCDASGSGSNLQYYLYDTSLNKVTNGITNEDTNVTNTSYELKTLNFTFAPTLTNQTYYLAMWSDAGGGPGGNLYVAYDTAAGNDHWYDLGVSYNAWPNTIAKDGTVSDQRCSIYCTYTAGGRGGWSDYDNK